MAESTTLESPRITAIEGGRPGGGTNTASNDSLRFPSARRFQERRRPQYPGTSRSIPA